ncbi:unnamed protein product [Urochloa humidicola]
MAQMQFFAGNQLAGYEVDALAAKLNAIGVVDGVQPAAVDDTMAVDDESLFVAETGRIKVKTLSGRVIDVDVEATEGARRGAGGHPDRAASSAASCSLTARPCGRATSRPGRSSTSSR